MRVIFWNVCETFAISIQSFLLIPKNAVIIPRIVSIHYPTYKILFSSILNAI